MTTADNRWSLVAKVVKRWPVISKTINWNEIEMSQHTTDNTDSPANEKLSKTLRINVIEAHSAAITSAIEAERIKTIQDCMDVLDNLFIKDCRVSARNILRGFLARSTSQPKEDT